MEMDEEASDAYQPSVEIEEREAHLQNTEQCEPIRKVDDSQLPVEPEFEFASADDDANEAIVEEETPTPREMGDSQLVIEPESDVSKDDNDVKEAAVEYKTPAPGEDYSQLAIEPEIAAPKDDNGGKEAVAEVDDLLHVVEPELYASKEDTDNVKEEEAAAEEEETPASRDIDESQRAVETELAAPMEDAGEKDGEEETSESQDGEEETSESHEMDVSQLAVEPEPAVPMEDAGYEKGGEAAAEEEKFPSPFEMNSGDDLQLEPELTAAEDDDDEEAVAGEEETPTPREMDNSQLVVEPELAVTTIAAGDNDDEEAVVGEEEIPTPREMDNLQLVVESELAVTKDDDEEAVAEGEENPTPEMETEMEVAEAGRGSGGRKKRGRNSRATVKVTPKKKREEEDVCFICFDGGDLFLCDRRGCSKAYHPSCVNRDEAFFRAKGRWNCGWHQCSICEKNAYYMCYTCTYSLCKNCIQNAVILCVRGSKGFCETCIQTIRLIEKNEQGNNETAQVDFDDKSSFEYLFKDYWVGLKGKLLLTSDEIAQAKNPWKGSDVHAGKQDTTDELYDANNDGGSASDSSGNLEATSSKRRKAKKRSKSKEGDSPIASDSSYGNLEAKKSKKRKTKKRLKPRAKDSDSPSAASAISAEGTSTPGNTEWASKELLEFVMHMRDGDASVLSQFDVQELLLKYITMNNLRDPRRKSYTICDSRLENLFGKPRVQHMEMLKLLESHFFIKEDSQADDLQGSVVDTEGSQLEADEHDALMKGGKDDKRKRKRGGERGLQSNLDGYAAIDIHNINLVYLRRNLMEAIIDDTETFHDKVVGSFVRIRISGSGQKHDMYRLVQIVGTNKAAEPYKVGKKTTDIMLEILNLNKTEVISIDIISNQEFTEDECKRLRQSIKCGLINRLTVGEIQEKALALQAVRVNDWLEAEVLRLNHLRDRASDMGRKKEHRECVEKLQLLETPEERQRRLEEVPEVHEDPNMDPNYESEDEGETEDKKRENFMKQRGRGGFSRRGMDQVSPREGSGFNRRGMDPISSREGGGFFNRRGMDPVSPREGSGFFNRRGMDPVSPRDGGVFNRRGRDPVSPHNDAWSGSRNREFGRSMSNRGFSIKKEDTTSEILNENPWSQGRDRDPHQLNSWDNKQKTPIMERGGFDNNTLSIPKSESFSETSPSTLSAAVATPASNISETDKMWHYKDPSGTVQGPFSIVQLRKWNNTGYFPKDLRIWKTNEKPEDAIILTDLLAGNSLTNAPVKEEQGGKAGLSVETLKVSTNGWGSELGINNSSNLPSPTPSQTTAGRTGGEQASEEKVSKFYHVRTTEVVEFSQQIGVNVPSSAPVPATPTPDSRNSGANMVQSVNMQQMSASESQVWGNAPSQPNHQMHHMPIQQQQQQQQQPPFGHWGNPPSTIQNPVGNFQNQGFSGMPPSEPWRPPVQNNPSNMQQLPGPPNMNTGWAPMQGNPNMGWGGPGPMPGNQNMNWGAPVQGPTPGNPNSNPGWGVVPVQGPTHGNAIPAWGVVPGQGQPLGNVNPGWGVVPGQAPNPSWGPPNQGWVVSNQAQPVPGNTNPGWVQPGQAPTPGNPNPGWVQPGQGPVPGNPNPGWVQPGQAPAPVPIPGNVNNPGQAPPPGNGNWVAPNQGPAPVNMNTGWVPTSQGAAPGNANQGWVPPSGNQNNGGGGRFSGQRGGRGGGSGRGGRTNTCYNCGQAGHYARECNSSKNMNTQQRRQ